MEEEQIEAIKGWLKSKSVRDIQLFLGFANFYRRFMIRNFSKIAALLISMLQTTGNNGLNTQAGRNEKNEGRTNSISGGASGLEAGGSIEHISITVKSAKSKLTKPQKSDFAFSGTDFLTSKAKKAFIHLQKAFTEARILRHFDPECHIRIETDVLGYAIGGVLSQLNSKTSLVG